MATNSWSSIQIINNWRLLIIHQPDFDKIYLYAKDPYEAKYQLFWLLICLVIKKLNTTVTESFIRGRKLNISLVFITQFYFIVPKNIRLNSPHYFIMKIPNKRELQQIAFNHLSDIDLLIYIKNVLWSHILF